MQTKKTIYPIYLRLFVKSNPCLFPPQDPVKEMAALQLLQRQSQHSNVEELEEAMADDTTLYKVTPWYDGGELFDLAPMPEASAKTVFAQLLDGLKFVHSKGVCMYKYMCFHYRHQSRAN